MIRKIVIAAACLLFGSFAAFAASPAPMTDAVAIAAVHTEAAPVLMPVAAAVTPTEVAVPAPITRDVALSEPMQLPDAIVQSWGDDDDGGPVWTPTWDCPWRPLKPWDWCL